MTQFESKFKHKVNVVSINVDQMKTPEYKKFAYLTDNASGIPHTVWVVKNKAMQAKTGKLSLQKLNDITAALLKKVAR